MNNIEIKSLQIPNKKQQGEPIIRRAEEKDYSDIFRIWMQPHIIQWMSFAQMNEEDFRPLYEQFSQKTQIYVMEVDGKIVGVRRLAFGEKGSEKEHTVGFYSMGIDASCTRKGYASRFYEEFTRIAKEHQPQITRIEFTQSYSNKGAFELSDKLGYKKEASVPGWLYRTQNGGTYNLPERYVYKLLDPAIEMKNPRMEFKTKLPSIDQTSNEIEIRQEGNLFFCYDQQGKLLGKCEFIPGPRVVSHLLFWSVSIEKDADLDLMTKCLRELIIKAHQQGFKKIELTSADTQLLQPLQHLGFHYRGTLQASIKKEDGYYNEVCADFGFYGIEEAKQMLPAFPHKGAHLNQALDECKEAIANSLKQGEIDMFMAIYLENLAFQIVEQKLIDYPLYTEQSAPWNGSMQLDLLPQPIHLALNKLIQ